MILYPYSTDNSTDGKLLPCAVTLDGGIVPRDNNKIILLPFKIEEERAA